MSLFTAFINLELPAHGEYPNSWEVPANANFALIDVLFDGVRSDGGGGGHVHDGTPGQGPQIRHDELVAATIGSYDHDDIDTHIDDTSIHFTERLVTVSDDGVSTVVNDVLEIQFPNAVSIVDAGGGVVVVNTGSVGSGGPVGVPSHLPVTYPPVAVTDYFNGVNGQPLSSSNWFVTAPQGVELLVKDEAATLAQDVSLGGVAQGTNVNRVKAQVPHSEVQRVTLYVCRVGTDDFVEDTDVFSFQLALMSSVFAGVNSISRLGLFFKIDVFKQSGQIYMTRTLYAIPTVGTSGNGNVTVLWTDTGPVSDFRSYLGSHEFSLDRNHAFHYSYNNGPVNMGTANNTGAATPFIATLSNSLMSEYTAYSQASGPLGIAPQFGRFGFDTAWAIPQSGLVDASFRFFTATSTDDENLYYSAVKRFTNCDEIPPQPQPLPCCDSGLYSAVEVGTILPTDPPTGSGLNSVVNYTVIQRIPEGDSTYWWAGFLLRRTGFENDPNADTYPVYCEVPANVEVRTIVPGRPCTTGGRIEIRGDYLPDLLDKPEITPTLSSEALDTPLAPGAGNYPQPIPYPVPYLPGSVVGGPPNTTAGIWSNTLPVVESVIEVTDWYRDLSTGSIIIDFNVGDGLPYGASLDVTLTSLVNSASTVTVNQAIILYPPAPAITQVRYFQRDVSGDWVELDPLDGLPESSRIYMVVCGKRLPLPIPKTTDASSALNYWTPGFPVDLLDTGSGYDLTGHYFFVDQATGLRTSNITIHQMWLYKGWFDLNADELPATLDPDVGNPTDGFPPVNATPTNLLGETIFLEIELDMGEANNEYLLRIIELNDTSLPPAELSLPTVAGAAPIITGIEVSPDISVATGKTVTLYGRNFDDPPVITVAGSVISNIDAETWVSINEVTFTCDFDSAATETIQLTNPNGLSDTIDIVVASASAPSISGVGDGINPLASVTAATRNQPFEVQGINFDSGAVLDISPAVNIRNLVFDDISDTFTFIADVPSAAGTDLTFLVTNPNGNASSPFLVPISAPAGPALTSFTYLDPQGVALPDQDDGQRIGAIGILKITGTGFRTGATVTVDVPQYVSLGTASVLSATEIQVDYEISESAPILSTVTVTVTDPDATSTDTDTFDIFEPLPIITVVNVANPHEGAGAAGVPSGSAMVRIYGSNFFAEGADNILSVEVNAGTPYGSVTSWTTVSDNLIEISELVLNPGDAGNTIQIDVIATNGATASYSFDIEDAVIPAIEGWTVHPSSIAAALDPVIVAPGASSHEVRLYGANLTTWITDATLTGPFVGTPSPTLTASVITVTLPTINSPLGATEDPTVYAELTLAGSAVPLTFALFQVDTTAGATPTITEVTKTNVIEGSRAGLLRIDGTDLSANVVGRVELSVNDSTKLPLSVSPNTSLKPVQTRIVEQTSTYIIVELRIADTLATADVDFRVKIYDPTGAEHVVTAFDVEIDPFPSRPKIDTIGAIDPAASAANDVTIDLTEAVGDEYIDAVGVDNLTPIATGSPLSRRVTFDCDATPGTEAELRVMAANGQILDIYRFTTTV